MKTAGGSVGKNLRQLVVKKRSVVLHGRKTSVSLEDEFWNGLAEIAAEERATLASTIERIGGHGKVANLSSQIRTAVLQHYRDRAGTP